MFSVIEHLIDHLSIISAILGLLGGVILAFSLNRVLSEVQFSIDALALSIESVARTGDVYLFTGLDDRLNKAKRISSSWVRAGIYCLVASVTIAASNIYIA